MKKIRRIRQEMPRIIVMYVATTEYANRFITRPKIRHSDVSAVSTAMIMLVFLRGFEKNAASMPAATNTAEKNVLLQ